MTRWYTPLVLLFVALSLPAFVAAQSTEVAIMNSIRDQFLQGGFTAWPPTGDFDCATQWSGVVCDPSGYVSKILLPSNTSLGGVVFPSDNISLLANLTELDLSFTGVQGELTPNLGKLSKLTKLNLAGNNLTGSIPHWPNQVFNTFLMHSNSLSGPLPLWLQSRPSFAQDTSKFDIRFNSFGCNLPEWCTNTGQDMCGPCRNQTCNIPSKWNQCGATDICVDLKNHPSHCGGCNINCSSNNTASQQYACSNGICQLIGCDGVVGSGRKNDSCGVCAGNNDCHAGIKWLIRTPLLDGIAAVPWDMEGEGQQVAYHAASNSLFVAGVAKASTIFGVDQGGGMSPYVLYVVKVDGGTGTTRASHFIPATQGVVVTDLVVIPNNAAPQQPLVAVAAMFNGQLNGNVNLESAALNSPATGGSLFVMVANGDIKFTIKLDTLENVTEMWQAIGGSQFYRYQLAVRPRMYYAAGKLAVAGCYNRNSTAQGSAGISASLSTNSPGGQLLPFVLGLDVSNVQAPASLFTIAGSTSQGSGNLYAFALAPGPTDQQLWFVGGIQGVSNAVVFGHNLQTYRADTLYYFLQAVNIQNGTSDTPLLMNQAQFPATNYVSDAVVANEQLYVTGWGVAAGSNQYERAFVAAHTANSGGLRWRVNIGPAKASDVVFRGLPPVPDFAFNSRGTALAATYGAVAVAVGLCNATSVPSQSRAHVWGGVYSLTTAGSDGGWSMLSWATVASYINDVAGPDVLDPSIPATRALWVAGRTEGVMLYPLADNAVPQPAVVNNQLFVAKAIPTEQDQAALPCGSYGHATGFGQCGCDSQYSGRTCGDRLDLVTLAQQREFFTPTGHGHIVRLVPGGQFYYEAGHYPAVAAALEGANGTVGMQPQYAAADSMVGFIVKRAVAGGKAVQATLLEGVPLQGANASVVGSKVRVYNMVALLQALYVLVGVLEFPEQVFIGSANISMSTAGFVLVKFSDAGQVLWSRTIATGSAFSQFDRWGLAANAGTVCLGGSVEYNQTVVVEGTNSTVDIPFPLNQTNGSTLLLVCYDTDGRLVLYKTGGRENTLNHITTMALGINNQLYFVGVDMGSNRAGQYIWGGALAANPSPTAGEEVMVLGTVNIASGQLLDLQFANDTEFKGNLAVDPKGGNLLLGGVFFATGSMPYLMAKNLTSGDVLLKADLPSDEVDVPTNPLSLDQYGNVLLGFTLLCTQGMQVALYGRTGNTTLACADRDRQVVLAAVDAGGAMQWGFWAGGYWRDELVGGAELYQDGGKTSLVVLGMAYASFTSLGRSVLGADHEDDNAWQYVSAVLSAAPIADSRTVSSSSSSTSSTGTATSSVAITSGTGSTTSSPSSSSATTSGSTTGTGNTTSTASSATTSGGSKGGPGRVVNLTMAVNWTEYVKTVKPMLVKNLAALLQISESRIGLRREYNISLPSNTTTRSYASLRSASPPPSAAGSSSFYGIVVELGISEQDTEECSTRSVRTSSTNGSTDYNCQNATEVVIRLQTLVSRRDPALEMNGLQKIVSVDSVTADTMTNSTSASANTSTTGNFSTTTGPTAASANSTESSPKSGSGSKILGFPAQTVYIAGGVIGGVVVLIIIVVVIKKRRASNKVSDKKRKKKKKHDSSEESSGSDDDSD